MECPNCSFENTPGTSVCVRCGSAMDLVGIDVHPPRQPGGLRGWWARRRTPARAIRRAARVGKASRLRRAAQVVKAAGPRWVLWCLVPGTGQIARGPRWLGWVLLVAWLVGAAGTTVLAGTRDGGYCYGLVLTAHAVSLAVLFRPGMRAWYFSGIQRVAIGLGAFLLLHYVVYGVVRYMAHGVAVPVELRVLGENRLVQNGDVVLYEGWSMRSPQYRRGDIVMYLVRGQHDEGYRVHGGHNLDRIIGLPGDRVAVREGRLWVNGQPSAARPLGGLGHFPRDVEIQAGENEYIIIPSLMGYLAPNPAAERDAGTMYVRASHVPAEDVLGKVIWRVRPWSRFGRLE